MSDTTCRLGLLTWPLPHSLAEYEAYMHRRLLHLRGQVHGGRHDGVGVRPSNLNFCVESTDIDLSRGDGLLSKAYSTTQFGDFCITGESRDAFQMVIKSLRCCR